MQEIVDFLKLPIEDPVLIVAIVMLIILIAPLVFKRFKIPGIVGIIIFGTVVGPSVTGLLERDSTIILLGTVGLLYLMFMAGLSIDLNQFNRLRNRSIAFGVISFGIPMGLSMLIGPKVLGFSTESSLLLGAIVGSHTLLAYPIANRLGITKNTAVTMTMGGTMVTDSLSLFVLALVAGSLGGGITTSFLTTFGTSVALFLTVSLLVIPRLGRWFFRTFPKENDTEYVFLVAILFVTAWFADLAGLAPIIGAFLAGLLLNRLVPDTSPLMNRVQFVGNALFIPFFLISVGMLVDVSVLISYEVWLYTLSFTGLVVVGKYLAAIASQFFFKYSAAEGLSVFGLSSPQAAATLAVTLVGFDLGLFTEVSVNAVVIMILITCLVGPYIVEKYGRIVAIQDAQKKYSASDAPQRIMVPLSNPDTAEALMDIAFAMRDKNSAEYVYPLTVVRDGNNVESQVANSEKMLAHAVIYASGADVPVIPVTGIDMNISNGITRAIREKRVTNVIIGWNGESSARKQIFGGVLDQLLEQSKEMVMVCKIGDKINTNSKVVFAIPPFSSLETGFAESLRYTKILVNQIGATLTIVLPQDQSSSIKEIVKKTKPEVSTEYIELEKWANLFSKLDEILTDEHLFILNGSREGSISWRPGLDRIPGIVSKRYPNTNFIAVYPSEKAPTSDNKNQNDSSNGLSFFKPDKVVLDLNDKPIDELVNSLIEPCVSDKNVDINTITHAILDNSLEYTPEIIPGIAILDAHVDCVKNTEVVIGISKSGIKVPKASGEVNVLVIILNPDELGFDGHFRRLNQIAKVFRSDRILERLVSAKSKDEVLEILAGKEVAVIEK